VSSLTHCWVWGWTRSGDLCQKCAHCGWVSHEWPSISDKDDERVKESQSNHNSRCPGSPSCARKRYWQ
jgi:hypothetical protein